MEIKTAASIKENWVLLGILYYFGSGRQLACATLLMLSVLAFNAVHSGFFEIDVAFKEAV